MDDGKQPPIYVVEGELVALGLPTRDMVDLWLPWMNDPEVTRTLGNINVFTRESEERFYEGSAHDQSAKTFAIFERASARPIGTTQLRDINFRDGTATFGILIGDKSVWNRGYGTEATRLVLDFAFHALGLHNVLLTVFANNPRGQRAYEKAGFRVVGVRREARRLGQRWQDVVVMDAIPADFTSPALERTIHAEQPPGSGA